MYKYIKHLNEDYPVYLILHEKNKAHGLGAEDYTIKDNTKLIISPDASTNDIEACNRLIISGISVIITDHHIFENKGINPAIVVNNQTSEKYYNKNACGAHVTWDFIRALDEYYWTDFANTCLDLVALANISDSMDITSMSTRAVINIGLNDISNKMFQRIIKSQEFAMKGQATPHTISFSVTPLINAFLRLATLEERELMLKAFCEIEDETFEYTKRGESLPIEEDIYDHVIRLATSYRGKQNRIRDKALPTLYKLAEEQINNKIIILNVNGIIEASLTGLVAIKLSEAINKPVLLGSNTKNGFSGSGRNFDNSPVENLRDLVDKCPYSTMSSGHPSAHGFSLSNIESATEWLNSKLKDISMEKIYKCDFVLDVNDLDISFIKDIDNMQWLFGHGLKEPKIAIENICISKDDISLYGKNMDTISFEIDGIKFIKFKCTDGDPLYDYINSWEDTEEEIIINAIVECGLNNYNGIITPQCTIIECEISGAPNEI